MMQLKGWGICIKAADLPLALLVFLHSAEAGAIVVVGTERDDLRLVGLGVEVCEGGENPVDRRVLPVLLPGGGHALEVLVDMSDPVGLVRVQCKKSSNLQDKIFRISGTNCCLFLFLIRNNLNIGWVS